MLVLESVVRKEKVWRVSADYRSKAIADIFIQRNLSFYVDQSPIYFSLECHFVLKFCILGGKWLLKIFPGRT